MMHSHMQTQNINFPQNHKGKLYAHNIPAVYSLDSRSWWNLFMIITADLSLFLLTGVEHRLIKVGQTLTIMALDTNVRQGQYYDLYSLVLC